MYRTDRKLPDGTLRPVPRLLPREHEGGRGQGVHPGHGRPRRRLVASVPRPGHAPGDARHPARPARPPSLAEGLTVSAAVCTTFDGPGQSTMPPPIRYPLPTLLALFIFALAFWRGEAMTRPIRSALAARLARVVEGPPLPHSDRPQVVAGPITRKALLLHDDIPASDRPGGARGDDPPPWVRRGLRHLAPDGRADPLSGRLSPADRLGPRCGPAPLGHPPRRPEPRRSPCPSPRGLTMSRRPQPMWAGRPSPCWVGPRMRSALRSGIRSIPGPRSTAAPGSGSRPCRHGAGVSGSVARNSWPCSAGRSPQPHRNHRRVSDSAPAARPAARRPPPHRRRPRGRACRAPAPALTTVAASPAEVSDRLARANEDWSPETSWGGVSFEFIPLDMLP